MQCNQIEDQELIVPYHLNYINPCYLMLFQTISHHFTLFWTHLHGKNPKRMVKLKHIPNLNQHIPLITWSDLFWSDLFWSDLFYSILFLTSSKCLFIHHCCCRYWLGTDKREGRGGKGREGKGGEVDALVKVKPEYEALAFSFAIAFTFTFILDQTETIRNQTWYRTFIFTSSTSTSTSTSLCLRLCYSEFLSKRWRSWHYMMWWGVMWIWWLDD